MWQEAAGTSVVMRRVRNALVLCHILLRPVNDALHVVTHGAVRPLADLQP